MTRYQLIALLILIFLIGFFKVYRRLNKAKTDLIFSFEFLEKLKTYLDSNGNDTSTYGWLLNRSNKMQNTLGGYGIIHQFKPPFANYAYKNYPIILNMIPEVRKNMESISMKYAHEYAITIQECIIRYAGTVEDLIESLMNELLNPFVWIRETFQIITALPFFLLNWFGIISVSALRSITSNIFFRLLSGFFAVVGFLSAIIGILTGWEKFTAVLSALF